VCLCLCARRARRALIFTGYQALSSPAIKSYFHRLSSPIFTGYQVLCHYSNNKAHASTRHQQSLGSVSLSRLHPAPLSRYLSLTHTHAHTHTHVRLARPSQELPFVVHDGCRERWGKYTCDKRRGKQAIVSQFAPVCVAFVPACFMLVPMYHTRARCGCTRRCYEVARAAARLISTPFKADHLPLGECDKTRADAV
jgi:hypothetical protein